MSAPSPDLEVDLLALRGLLRKSDDERLSQDSGRMWASEALQCALWRMRRGIIAALDRGARA